MVKVSAAAIERAKELIRDKAARDALNRLGEAGGMIESLSPADQTRLRHAGDRLLADVGDLAAEYQTAAKQADALRDRLIEVGVAAMACGLSAYRAEAAMKVDGVKTVTTSRLYDQVIALAD